MMLSRITLEVIVSDDAEDIIDGQDAVSDGKDPVSDEITVSSEADRRKKLTHEKPFRHPLARAFFPLFVNLLEKCGKQEDRACPTHNFNHAARRREVCRN